MPVTSDIIDSLRNGFFKNESVVAIHVIGSGIRKKKLKQNDEIDLHVILDHANCHNINSAIDVITHTKTAVGACPYVETKRGPFRDDSSFQFHLIIDDLASITTTSAVTLADWNRNSFNVLGKPLDFFLRPDDVYSSFCNEVNRTIGMLSTFQIIYKQWVPAGRSTKLVEFTKKTTEVTQYLELVKYAYKAMSSDLAAFLDLSQDNVPTDQILRDFVDVYGNRSRLASFCPELHKRAVQWNEELLRIAGAFL